MPEEGLLEQCQHTIMDIFKGKWTNPDLLSVWSKARENANDSCAAE